VNLRTTGLVAIPVVLRVTAAVLLVVPSMVALMRLCTARHEDQPHRQQQGEDQQIPRGANAHSLIMRRCKKLRQTGRYDA
jgi:cytochrome c-type biogenesis protein CcmH/NrfG